MLGDAAEPFLASAREIIWNRWHWIFICHMLFIVLNALDVIRTLGED
jgi:hypothetical protein